ncbi:hypothetical protein AYK24_09920 [Thermoplasmatales archaeon SG8-52-4]|nr:MAG: hypothetical protein AYK24_09920 [Thermoplasmatales archaeon SG8-52-4]
MRKKIINILLCVLLIISFTFILPGPTFLGKTNNEICNCGRQIECSALIADNTRVIEINNTEDMVWQYNIGSADVEKLYNGNVLLAQTFIVTEVNILGGLVWQYSSGLAGVSDVERLNNGNTLITDMFNNYVIEVNISGGIVWQYSAGLSFPLDAERLSNGNTLIVNNLVNTVLEVTSNGTVVWQYATGLWSPSDAERLSNGNTLITDYLNSRVIEVNSSGSIVWQKTGLLGPKDAERLSNGNTLIVEYDNNRIIEVNSTGDIVWSYSTALNLPNDIELVPNQPPTTPIIAGPNKGLINIPYTFIFQATDPGGHTLYIFVDWGDGSNSGWLGPYLPSLLPPLVHTWTTQGTYTVKARVKDVCGELSGWGSLSVTMPRNKAINTPIFQFLDNYPNLFPFLRLFLAKYGQY